MTRHFTEKEVSVLVMLFDHGLLHKEIAEKLNRTEKSISSKLRALTRLRRRRWSDEEKRSPELARSLGRTETAIKIMKHRMLK
jgi:DNA-binding NarL/FixJ family response regulator